MEESKEEPRRSHRSWRDRLLLFYGERHLEEKRGRVAPAPVWAPLATGSRCEVVVAPTTSSRRHKKRRHIGAALGQDADEEIKAASYGELYEATLPMVTT